MTTAFQSLLQLSPLQAASGLPGAMGAQSPLGAHAADARESFESGFLRSLLAYLSGLGQPTDSPRRGLAGGAGGAAAGPFLPAGGDTLPHELTAESLEAVAETLGLDVQELVRRVMALANASQSPVGSNGSLEIKLDAASRTASREAPSEPAAVALRAEPARSSSADPSIARAAEQFLQEGTRDTVAGPAGRPELQAQSAALHAALQKALGDAGAQPTSALTGNQTQLSEAKSAESPLAGLTGLSQTQFANAGPERGIASGTLSAPFNQQGWSEELGQRIRWMVGNNLQAATLKINPPQLGPINIRINMQNDQMTIMFTAQHALVREALEDSVPRLRELMNEKGFDSVNVNISDDSSSRQRHSADAGSSNRFLFGDTDDDDAPPQAGADADNRSGMSQLASAMPGRVDFYA